MKDKAKEQWEKQLLQLDGQNPLLDLKQDFPQMELLCQDLTQLNDELHIGGNIKLMPRPGEGQEVSVEHKRIHTAVDEITHRAVLRDLYRRGRWSIEERGTNMLYIALGILCWYEDGETQAHHAPLLLVPVELEERMQVQSYMVKGSTEAVYMNEVLLEKLKRSFGINIGGLSPLPMDGKRVDVPFVMETLKQCIRGRKHWRIEERGILGLFPLYRSLFWKDLHTYEEELGRNKLVSSLRTGELAWDPLEDGTEEEELDDKILPCEMALPFEADSTQMKAVYEAARGQSLVLSGAAGTGKTQTIANVVANSMYLGKSVLVVSQKLQALQDLEKLISQAGLAPYSLEFYPGRISAKSLRSQIEASLTTKRPGRQEEFSQMAQKLYSFKKELNESLRAVHRERNFGCSLYEAMSGYEKYAQYEGRITFSADSVGRMEPDTFALWEEKVKECAEASIRAGGFVHNAFRRYGSRDDMNEGRQQFLKDIDDYITTISHLRGLLEYLQESIQYYSGSHLEDYREMDQIIEKAFLHAQTNQQILRNFKEGVLAYDVNAAKASWGQARKTWFLPKKRQSDNLVKELRYFALNPAEITAENISEWYNLLMTERETTEFLGTAPSAYGYLIEEIMKGPEESKAAQKAKEYMECYGHFNKMKSKFTSIYDADFEDIYKLDNWGFKIISELGCWQNNIDRLGVWTKLLKKIDELNVLGLENVTEAFQTGVVTQDDLYSCFMAGAYQAMAAVALGREPVLTDFNGADFDRLIELYNRHCRQYQGTLVKEIVARVTERMPFSSQTLEYSRELAALQKAVTADDGDYTIGEMMDILAPVSQIVFPCMIMTPTAVQEYLSDSFSAFDLVIWDEAALTRTQEAAAVLRRGERMIIAGDDRMPGAGGKTCYGDPDGNDVLDNLLEDCEQLPIPRIQLNRVYRRGHESLTGYINRMYYGRSLDTFPENQEHSGHRKLRVVPGIFDKEQLTNEEEAAQIVKAIFAHIQDEKLRRESIGVVTFSKGQQELIEDRLNQAFRNDPKTEVLCYQLPAPILIKWAVDVQGDQRDVVYLSTAYGPDRDGQMPQNYLVYHQEQIWRQINAAISASVEQLIVYASVRSKDIDVNFNQNAYLLELKELLQDLEQTQTPEDREEGEELPGQDVITDMIELSIQSMGYKTRRNIGDSAYQVDIGVYHPLHSDELIMGVICYGNVDHAQGTLRDVMIERSELLKRYGWNIWHVWSIDWMNHTQEAQIRLRSALDGIVREQSVR